MKGFVWIGPNMPHPVQSPEYPLSPSAELWGSILDGLRERRAEFVAVAESLPGIFAVHAGNSVSPKTLEQFERIVAEANSLALERAVAVFNQSTETHLEALAKESQRIPVMLLHGDADQGMPLEASSALIKQIVPWAELNVYQNAGHGM
jgi:pimeloyl-ACP methyl ester carboxylesterase